MSHIETSTGRRFTPLSPVVEDICIDDIAHALSNQCRFSGHTREHYSVAEHSVRVSCCVEAAVGRLGFAGRAAALWGLLHDASEAYLVDLPTPLKSSPSLGPAYRAAEGRLMTAICERFHLEPDMPSIVRAADETLLVTEVRDLMPGRAEHWARYADVSPLPERIVPWSPVAARREFLCRFNELGGNK